MPRYIRDRTKGASYFFTVVTGERVPWLCDASARQALRIAVTRTRAAHPFTVVAWVLMPEHMHCVWTLPDGDDDFPLRWNLIKRLTTLSLRCGSEGRASTGHRESGRWQRRYWEHRIRDERDLATHVEYTHFNPVRHGLVARACDWPHSSFHRFVANGLLARDWAAGPSRAGCFGE